MKSIKKYISYLKLNLINKFEYKHEFIMSTFIGIIVFFGQYVFWYAVFGGDTTKIINGFTLPQIITYYLLLRLVSEMVESKAGFRLSELITSGNISNLLIKPVKIRLWFLVEEVSRLVADVLFKIILYSILLVILGQIPQLDAVSILFFMSSLILSFVLSFNIYYVTGCIAFVTDASSGINYALRRIIFFLSGGLIPLSFFPEILRNFLGFLPFGYIFDFPMTILLKQDYYSVSEVLTRLGIQLGWAVVMTLLVSILFKYLVKRNISAGI